MMTRASVLYEHYCANNVWTFEPLVDRVVVPALLERFLRGQAVSVDPSEKPGKDRRV